MVVGKPAASNFGERMWRCGSWMMLQMMLQRMAFNAQEGTMLSFSRGIRR